MDVNKSARETMECSDRNVTGRSFVSVLVEYSDDTPWVEVRKEFEKRTHVQPLFHLIQGDGDVQPTRFQFEFVEVQGSQYVVAEGNSPDDRGWMSRLIKNIPAALIAVDTEGRVLHWNPSAQRIFGWSREEVLGQPLPIIPEDKRSEFDRFLEASVDGRQVHRSETTRVTKDGRRIEVMLSTAPLEDASGNVVGGFGMMLDITARKQTQKQLEHREALFRSLFENAGIGMAQLTPDGTIQRVNQRLAQFLRYDNDEISGMSLKEISHPGEIKHDEKQLGCLLNGEISHFTKEKRYIRSDGTQVWGEVHVSLVRDSEGDPEYIIGAVKDITDRKLLREQRDQFFELSLDLICIADHDGYFRYVNPSFQRILGYEENELLDTRFIQFVHPDDRERTEEAMNQLKSGDVITDFRNRYRTARGDIRWLSWQAVSKEDRIYAIARDVTEQKEYREDLEQTLEEKELLLREVHHRVKNNLQVISSLLEMQARQIDDSNPSEAFRDSVSRVRTMAMIHEKLYRSGQSGVVDIESYLRELVKSLIETRLERPEQVNWDLEVEALDISLDHAIPLGMIVNELVGNSIEHGFANRDSGWIRVVFEIRSQSACLRIEDNGRGVQDLEAIKHHSSMGFKIVRSLVEHELKGSISLDQDQGLIVEIEFPIEFDRS